MTILITGIHGFVGSNLVGYLSQGRDNTIYGLDIVAPEKPGVAKTFSWDDLEAGNIPEVDAVIHLAGKAHDTKNKAAADVYFKVNTGLTQKIFDWFLSCKGTKKFVFFSTAKSAADRVEGVLTEDVVPAPVGPYGESKIKAEEYMIGRFAPAAAARPNRSFDDSDSAFPGKSVYILRPCMIHGPGNKGNLNLLYSVVSRGIPWPLGAFDNLRTFTSVENICYAVSGLLTKDIPSGIQRPAHQGHSVGNLQHGRRRAAFDQRTHSHHLRGSRQKASYLETQPRIHDRRRPARRGAASSAESRPPAETYGELRLLQC